MVRVKRGTIHTKKRRKLLSQTKGFRWGRKNKIKLAKEALLHSLSYAYAHRRTKKREKRRLWQVQINAGVRELGLTYSKFMGALKKKNIEIDRKILATLATKHPEIFKKIVQEVTEV